jgi:hypothetical protein
VFFTFVPEIQESVVHSIYEELRSSRVGCPCVGHGESSWLIGKLWASLFSEFVRNRSLSVSGDSSFAWNFISRVWGWSACPCTVGIRITTVRAAELNHKSVNHSMEVKTVVKSVLGQVNEVICKEIKKRQNKQEDLAYMQ